MGSAWVGWVSCGGGIVLRRHRHHLLLLRLLPLLLWDCQW
jgi:hypothetical protein